ncbi:ABC-2 type transport system permease protein [Hymenobacter daecheongensis DSM 21074]|uniref:ABC-2 type transport system permease protein n=1 Tax=Hymenobacter daecheongensis DSM 21074 TaxID=1121955 RepID=A0A1M6GDS3_9BACT|nr:ABC transporter permease [Hymenobacter daecheongensis]SHJ08080.1 ABC-2 type transport system permease protein [Hymenobacter daecheongensis DSM 21074]
MDKIWLIIQREYLTRVRKKSFLVISLLAPLLLAGTTLGIAKLSMPSSADEVAVYDASGLNLLTQLVATDEVRFVPAVGASPAAATAAFKKAKPKQAALLVFPADFSLDANQGVQLLADGNVSLNRQQNIRKAVNKAISELKLTRSGLTRATIDNLKADVELSAVDLTQKGGQKNNVGATTAAAYFLSILVYMFIFIYGVQVMRGVAEEKTNRIMEVMMSSVKPFQLMMGKILGIAAVVLTQFGIWLILSYSITTLVAPLLMKPAKTPVTTAAAAANTTNAEVAAAPAADAPAVAAPRPGTAPNLWSVLDGLPIGSIIGGFLFFFLGGYLLYSSMFAAIGAAVDDQTDAQQFMFPVTIPLILSYIVSINVIINGDPNGPLAFWLSMIPFTSPIAMVMRLPFGVPAWQLLLSGALLVGGFIFTTWVASRIYRVGVLMYGKKVTYAELSRWMFYKG